MEYMAKNIPLWQVTTWDKNFNNVDKEWQPKTIKYKYLLSDELDSLRVDDGDVRILYTGKDVGYTTEKLAGDNISEGEIVSIPWGGIPTVKYHKGKFVTGDNRIATSNDTSKLTNKYLYYYMKGNISEIASYYRGASLKHPCMKDILKMTISYPSVQEQEKICSQFDMLEQLIEARKQELQLLDELIKARFVELFDDEIKCSDMTIADVADEATVGIANSATHAYSESGVVMLRNQNIRVNYLDDRDLIYITQDFADQYPNKALQENDILITRTGANVGMACIVPKKYAGCQTFTTLILRLKKNINISPIFVCHYINLPIGKAFVDENKIGGGQPNFGAKQLATMPIVIPTERKQIEFENLVKQVDKSKVAVQKALEETQMLFNSLMQKYFG